MRKPDYKVVFLYKSVCVEHASRTCEENETLRCGDMSEEMFPRKQLAGTLLHVGADIEAPGPLALPEPSDG